ncbi:hypothetical protein F4778DRAFT_749386 [Xylariomycetidae sp. FL2044]|nr:hypothetical protein F4778DRAFT_749386 [Xylariomycetidae sp. FL2044]
MYFKPASIALAALAARVATHALPSPLTIPQYPLDIALEHREVGNSNSNSIPNMNDNGLGPDEIRRYYQHIQRNLEFCKTAANHATLDAMNESSVAFPYSFGPRFHDRSMVSEDMAAIASLCTQAQNNATSLYDLPSE